MADLSRLDSAIDELGSTVTEAQKALANALDDLVTKLEQAQEGMGTRLDAAMDSVQAAITAAADLLHEAAADTLQAQDSPPSSPAAEGGPGAGGGKW